MPANDLADLAATSPDLADTPNDLAGDLADLTGEVTISPTTTSPRPRRLDWRGHTSLLHPRGGVRLATESRVNPGEVQAPVWGTA